MGRAFSYLFVSRDTNAASKASALEKKTFSLLQRWGDVGYREIFRARLV